MPPQRAGQGRTAPLVAGAVVLPPAATLWLFHLLWRGVPAWAGRLADEGASLTRAGALVISLASWFVRLLPLLVVLSIPLGLMFVIGAVVALSRGVPARVVVEAVALLACTVGVLELLVGALVAVVIH